MKRVILLCGPRGVGKSTYAEAVRAMHPDVRIVSRDKIAIELFGKTSFSPYTGQCEYVRNRAFGEVGGLLAVPENDTAIIFDYWNGYASCRQGVVRKLRELGADEVWAWYFVTPIDVSARQFYIRESREGSMNESAWKLYRERSYCHDFRLFHEQAGDLMKRYERRSEPLDPDDDMYSRIDGFDSRFDWVDMIDACQRRIPGLPFFPDVAADEALCRFL